MKTRSSLQRVELTEQIDDGPGGRTVQRTYTKGALRVDEITSNDFSVWREIFGAPSVSSREHLESLCCAARGVLSKAGLPTDQESHWVAFEGEPLRLLTDADREEIRANRPKRLPTRLVLWTAIVDEASEPISKERAAKELLWDINRFRDHDPSDALIGATLRLMHSYYKFFLEAGNVNELVIAGQRSNRGRSKGPVTRHTGSAANQLIIQALARKLWATDPRFIDNNLKTAQAIEADVNHAIRAAGRKPLATKTIADNLTKILRSGESGDANGQSGN